MFSGARAHAAFRRVVFVEAERRLPEIARTCMVSPRQMPLSISALHDLKNHSCQQLRQFRHRLTGASGDRTHLLHLEFLPTTQYLGNPYEFSPFNGPFAMCPAFARSTF